jgi:hypothetical protein
MTIEEVVFEMRVHLAERKSPRDHIVPAGNWRELLTGAWSYDRFKRAVQKQPAGAKLWQVYIKARNKHLALHKQALPSQGR